METWVSYSGGMSTLVGVRGGGGAGHGAGQGLQGREVVEGARAQRAVILQLIGAGGPPVARRLGRVAAHSHAALVGRARAAQQTAWPVRRRGRRRLGTSS